MGDGILVEFPSPVEAARSAVEIQEGAALKARTAAEDRSMFGASASISMISLLRETISMATESISLP
jgi:hypothetical protein